MPRPLSEGKMYWLRYLASGGGGDFTHEHCELASECLDEIERLRCQVPPEGWACTRPAGHEGPCAAVPKDNGED